ncbi:cytochrome P450 [Leucogyrophana mollusca]|uniref:Cytochrome P450 n=1 Tax=Leucogyrophana mollusca TaxID=85980 RepID=A0ACB8B4S0_9AGAM|nr:cytochrome P450 [Leucogyrophana mollusca]
MSWRTVTVAAFSVVVVSRVVKFIKGLKAVSFLPGRRVPFQPLSLPGVLFPETTWNPGLLFTSTWRHTRNIYTRNGGDAFSVVPYIHGAPVLYTQSMAVARQVVTTGHKSATFGKAESMAAALVFWGPSIATAEGDLWRKYRRIMAPAFNNQTYARVWTTSQRLYADLLEVEGWNSLDVVDVPSTEALTLKFALIIIASCGFGVPFSWAAPPSHDGQLSIQECLQTIAHTNVFAIAAPGWVWRLPFRWIQNTRRAYDSMRVFMHEHVRARREAIHSSETREKDVFTLLVEASEEEGGKMAMSDEELIGNTFALLFAGHETTGHTLAATLAFLALHEDVQEEVAAQVREVVSERAGGELLLEDKSRLDKVLAAFYEGVRMFPSALFLLREAKQDTTLTLELDNVKCVLPVKKGTHIVVDVIGVQYNPKYFGDPEEFRPSRWYTNSGDEKEDLTELEEVTAFGIGPRACLGRKFATTEALCLISHLLRDWRVEPLLALKGGPSGKASELESRDAWRTRVLKATLGLIMGLKDVPLRFVRRV